MQPAVPWSENKQEEPSKPRFREPRAHKNKREELIDALTSVRFWGGISTIVALISLSLPWWGITVVFTPSTYSSSWGLFFGSQSQSQPFVVFFRDRLDTALAANYSFMTALVVLTAIVMAIGAGLRRSSLMVISLVLSVVTVLSFLADLGNALSTMCNGVGVSGGSCISSLVGQGADGTSTVAWGFQAGFYTFIASALLALGTLALHLSRRE